MRPTSALLEGNVVLAGGSQKTFCAAPHTAASLKILVAKETDHPRQQTSRLVATNHNIDDVDWLQNLNEDITWIHGDPVQEISQQLKQREQTGKTTSELHIIAHGNNGEVKLGNIFLTKQYLEESSELLHDWNLEAIYLWSCEAGRNTELTTTLQALTGANIYVSKNEISRENPNLSSITGAKASLDALIGKTKTKQWRGKLASSKVLDANYQQLVFDHTNYDDSFTDPDGGINAGQAALFKNVITIGGQAVDALYTLQSIDSNLSITEVDDGELDSGYVSTKLFSNGGTKSATATISFYEAGTYQGASTGNKVTLENVVINTYDIDIKQFQVFKGFQSYELADNTGLDVVTQSDGSVMFDDGDPAQVTTGTEDAGRARVYYDAIDTFEIKMGSDNGGIIWFYLDFQLGPAWSGDTTTTDTPAANLSWSTRNLSEAVANDGSFSQSATITFNNPGTTVFAGSDGDAITHTATNVPSGLSTSVTRASATTATLTVTGNASAHTSANDLNNIELEFANSAFVVGSVGASSITDARITNFGLTFSDPTKGITIAQTGTTDGADLLTTEAGSSTTFTVVLDAEPTSDVTISLTDNDATEGALSGSTLSGTNTLTFTTTDWNTAQTVTITGVDDDIVDGDITTTLTATANTAGGYSGESTTTTVKNTDDDTNGITIAQTGTTDGADLLTTEAGSTSTFTVVLDAEPTSDVTVSLTGNDATEGALTGTTLSETNTLTFTTTDWNTAQTVTITGLDDDIVDGDITTTLTATANTAGGYSGESTTTTVKNTDDDTNGISIAQTGTTDGADLLTTEAGSTSTFTVVLDAEPTSDVTVSLTGNDATEGALTGTTLSETNTLTFTTTDWNTAQTVTVTGENDDVDDGDITTTLTATANTAGGYSGESTTTTVKNTDDDTNGITVAQTGTTDGADLLTSEAGGSSAYTVVLDAEPTADVTVTTTGNDATENFLSTDALTFTAANWNTAQTVTVNGVDDDIVDGDITTTLTTTASNTGNYAGTETSTVTVKNIDNDNSGPSPTPAPTPVPTPTPTPSPTPSPSPGPANPPNLIATNDGNGLTISGSESTGTWVNLQTNYSNADLQNSLQIISSKRGQIGSIGAISKGNIFGKTEIYLEKGETLSFAQQSSNNSIVDTPNIQLAEQNGSWRLVLEDSNSNTDNDFNDLGITISTHSECQSPGDYQIARQQKQITDGLFDLSNINRDSLELQITVNSSSDFSNRLAFVRLDDNANNLSLNGISASDAKAFKDAITGALIDPESQRVELQGESSQTITWNLNEAEFGLYAAVVITEENEIITIGSSGFHNGSPLLKSIGQNHFGFEDNPNSSDVDFDYNDLTFQVNVL